MTSQLSAALRAAASGLHPDEAGTGLIISHDAFLHGDDFTRHVEISASISDGTPIPAGSRRDRVLHEALTARTDPLHLALVFGLSHTTASRYTLIACDLLPDQPAKAAGEQHHALSEPDEVSEQ